MDEIFFEIAHSNEESEPGMSGAVSVDVVENAKQYFNATEVKPVNLDDALQGLLDFSHKKNVLPGNFHIQFHLEQFANDSEDDCYSQSLKINLNY